MRSIENRGILLKGTTRKINSREGGWLNDLDPLMKIAKSVLVPLGLTVAASGADGAIQKKIFGPGMTTLIVSKEGSEGQEF